MNDKESKQLVEEFSDLFSPLHRPLQSYRVHPSQRILKSYLKNNLKDEWQRPDNTSQPWMDKKGKANWTMTEVSLHVATCAQCNETITAWRHPKKKFAWFEEKICAFGIAGQKVRLWAYTYTAVALLILSFNFSFQTPLQESMTTHITYSNLPYLTAGDGLNENQLLNGYKFATYFRFKTIDPHIFFQSS